MSGPARTATPVALLLLLALAQPAHAGADRGGEEAVRVTVDRHGPGLRRCVARGLRDRPDLHRKLVVRFRIDRAGRVGPVTFVAGRGTLRHLGIERCVARVFRAIRFPRQGAATWFTTPLVFPS